MRLARRGLTVIGLVLILVVLGLGIFFLVRMMGREPAPGMPPMVADTGAAAVAPGATNPLADRLAVVEPRDSAAVAGDTIGLRVRATTAAGTAVARALIRFEVTAGGGSVMPDSATTDDLGEAQVRWALGGAAGPQTVRATVTGNDAASATTTLLTTARPGTGGGQ